MTDGPGIAAVAQAAPALLEAVRTRRPLIHAFANFVTMQAVANVIRAVGASPIMALAADEAEAVAGQADALVLSLGTPTPSRLEAMVLAGRRAADRQIPIVLDPVGIGASDYRTSAARGVLGELPVAVIRANRGEAALLAGYEGTVRGVDAAQAADRLDAVETARAVARIHACVVAVTGPQDVVADPDRLVTLRGGHPWLQGLSGAGCMATAMVGVFSAVGADRLLAAACALACYGAVSEMAAGRAGGPGTLVPALLDALFHLTPAALADALTRRIA